jgi:hypothetical protein
VYTFVRHTRGWIPGTASDRPLACLPAYCDQEPIAIFSGKRGRKPKGQNRPCLLAFFENRFFFPFFFLFQRYWLSNAFLTNFFCRMNEKKNLALYDYVETGSVSLWIFVHGSRI